MAMIIKSVVGELLATLQRLFMMTVLLLTIIGIEILLRKLYGYLGPNLDSRAIAWSLDLTTYALHALTIVVTITYVAEIAVGLVRRMHARRLVMEDDGPSRDPRYR